MLMHAIAHGGRTDMVRESALKIDWGKKNPLLTWDSNPRQYFRQAFQPDAVPAVLFPAPNTGRTFGLYS